MSTAILFLLGEFYGIEGTYKQIPGGLRIQESAELFFWCPNTPLILLCSNEKVLFLRDQTA
jgi:hypothetical protein